jgi:hypothetical protein
VLLEQVIIFVLPSFYEDAVDDGCAEQRCSGKVLRWQHIMSLCEYTWSQPPHSPRIPSPCWATPLNMLAGKTQKSQAILDYLGIERKASVAALGEVIVFGANKSLLRKTPCQHLHHFVIKKTHATAPMNMHVMVENMHACNGTNSQNGKLFRQVPQTCKGVKVLGD